MASLRLCDVMRPHLLLHQTGIFLILAIEREGSLAFSPKLLPLSSSFDKSWFVAEARIALSVQRFSDADDAGVVLITPRKRLCNCLRGRRGKEQQRRRRLQRLVFQTQARRTWARFSGYCIGRLGGVETRSLLYVEPGSPDSGPKKSTQKSKVGGDSVRRILWRSQSAAGKGKSRVVGRAGGGGLCAPLHNWF